MTVLVWVVALLVGGLTVHTGLNAGRLRRPTAHPPPVRRPISLLLPVRDEAHRIEACLRSILDQRGVPGLEVLILDDGSTDATADVVRATAAGDPRVRLVTGEPPPPGWLGKPYACQQLARLARGQVLVFVDADVVLAPDALAAAVELLAGLDLLTPYPRIEAVTAAERLVQPLLAWSWLTFLPVRAIERSPRPSVAAAAGQFLVASREAYERAGGHAAVRDRVIEDIELARVIKRAGGRVGLADASSVATCRMYSSWAELKAGYGKSLWTAFGSPGGGVAVAALLTGLYVLPPVVAVAGLLVDAWPWLWGGLGAYGLGVIGRVFSARATGGRGWPDPLAHPVSIAVFALLLAVSIRGRRRGTLAWKGRPVAR